MSDLDRTPIPAPGGDPSRSRDQAVRSRGQAARSRERALVRGLALLSILLAVAVAILLWRDLARTAETAAPETPVVPEKPVEEPPVLSLEPASFDDLPGWRDDNLDGFAAALARACGVRAKRAAGAHALVVGGLAVAPADWSVVCERAAAAADVSSLRDVLTSELRPWSMHDRDRDEGLVTGYYEPQLHGSLRRSARFKVPLYVRPPELIEIDLGAFREEYKGKRLAGVVNGNRLVPFADRAGVDGGALASRDLELVWVDDAIDAFFLHIQGSGRIALDDGTEMRVGYSAQNGHPYVAIGRELVARGALELKDVTMQSIRAWLAANPAEAAAVMQSNPSFIFFRKLDESGPVGSSGAVLEPYRSVAVDLAFVPVGTPLWMAGAWPSPRAEEADRPLQRLVVAQDTGGAIRGPLRADLFCGHGEEAAEIAGRLKHPFKGWMLLPRNVQPDAGVSKPAG